MLERSRITPLQISIEGWETVSLDLAERVVGEFSRLSSLSCDLRHPHLLETILRALGSSPSSSLVSVSIRFEPRWNGERLEDWVPILETPNWSTKWCQNLRELDLAFDVPIITFEDITMILSSSPKLENLSLRFEDLPPPRHASSEAARITLPLLATLNVTDLDGSGFHLQSLLGQLRIPSSAEVSLSFVELSPRLGSHLAYLVEGREITSFSYEEIHLGRRSLGYKINIREDSLWIGTCDDWAETLPSFVGR
ncbi:hypothetical protein AAF712_012398 [Marasmius tenuissimus]|uniref:Uncharacterized protein n=1 Tax=Marasmius tenuissimus TaxID=585030 RepID=A0ABR2ZHI8_9AGAR